MTEEATWSYGEVRPNVPEMPPCPMCGARSRFSVSLLSRHEYQCTRIECACFFDAAQKQVSVQPEGAKNASETMPSALSVQRRVLAGVTVLAYVVAMAVALPGLYMHWPTGTTWVERWGQTLFVLVACLGIIRLLTGQAYMALFGQRIDRTVSEEDAH